MWKAFQDKLVNVESFSSRLVRTDLIHFYILITYWQVILKPIQRRYTTPTSRRKILYATSAVGDIHLGGSWTITWPTHTRTRNWRGELVLSVVRNSAEPSCGLTRWENTRTTSRTVASFVIRDLWVNIMSADTWNRLTKWKTLKYNTASLWV